MSFGVKTNEVPGTRASARYVRISPSKVREVLNLIRGRTVAEADEILDLVERDAAVLVRKVLDSAVANAEANDDQDPERLYVSACYADEGPTMKRWRPRARGRATTIRKRTSHITVIVSRLSDEEFARSEARSSSASAGGSRRARVSASRAARVAKSRARDAEKAGLDEDVAESGDSPEDDSEAAESARRSSDEDDSRIGEAGEGGAEASEPAPAGAADEVEAGSAKPAKAEPEQNNTAEEDESRIDEVGSAEGGADEPEPEQSNTAEADEDDESRIDEVGEGEAEARETD